MQRKALTEKMIVLGVDGFEPRLAKKYLNQGKMPHLQKFIAQGACREDLVLLGAMPTVTPPLWTTLSTGAYPGTHGITCYFGHNHGELDSFIYNFDSARCKAEQLWDVYTQAGKKALVWHWPGSAWPPTSDSPNLHVVDGAQPIAVNAGVANMDIIKIIIADEKLKEVEYLANTASISPGAGCIIDDVESLMANPQEVSGFRTAMNNIDKGAKVVKNTIICEEENEVNSLSQLMADTIKSPIKPAQGWDHAPDGAKEFTIIVSKGVERRPALILQNGQGIYDTVAIYHSKKAAEPYVTLKSHQSIYAIIDTVKNDDGENIPCTRHYNLLELAFDGSRVNLIIDTALDMRRDDMFHPKSLYKDIVENVGPVPSRPGVNGKNELLVDKVFIPTYDNYCQWQADCLTYCMENKDYDVIFSHLHNVDSAGHFFWHYAKYQKMWGNNEKSYQGFMERIYTQTDNYLGRFLPFLDQGWTIIITSDHGLITQEHHGALLGEPGGVTTPVMEELGYTVLIKDAQGDRTHDIDWSKTRAIASRGNYVYLNLLGRDTHGIVDPKDQYALEEQIISDLYNYRDHETGKRVVAMAMRNKDAVLLGMNGPECGDIIYFTEESFNVIHADSLSTQQGYADTSVSPIFIAAGKGIKKGYFTDRVIRQVDVAPTMAILGGVRFPAQCEGAVVHQILSEDV